MSIRILHVSLSNLGIFRGEKHFDFASPTAAPGVFIAEGLNEAGCRTLFHAVCLALYGRPFPGAESLDVLSSEAGESFVTVRFAAEGAAPRTAVWSPAVSSDGEVDGRCFLDGEETEAPAEKITGLSFGTFARALFLSQRNVASFLNAGKEDRFSAFERLVGREMYGRGLILALAPCGDEESAPLVDEAENPKGVLGEKVRAARALERELEELNREGGGRALTEAQDELSAFERERQALDRKVALSAADRRRWEDGRRTLSLGAFYASLTQLRGEQEADKAAQFSIAADMPREQARVKSAEEALELAEIHLRDRLVAQKKLAEAVRATRELDVWIEGKKALALETQSSVQKLEKKAKELVSQSELQQETLENVGVALRGVRKFIQTNASDEKLVQELGGIRKCFELFGMAREKGRELKEAYSEAIHRKQQAQTALNDRQAMFSEISVQFSMVERRFQTAQNAFESSLKGKTLSEWREVLEAQRERLRHMEELKERLERQDALQRDLESSLDRRLTLESEKKDLSLKEVEQGERVLQEKETLRLLEDQATLMRLAGDLAEARRILQDGAPCPLCGAASHPYVAGGVLCADEVQPRLEQAREELEKTQALIVSQRGRMARLSEEIVSLNQDEARKRETLSSLEGEISETLAALNVKFAMGVPLLEEMKRLRQKERETLQKIQDATDAAAKAEQDLRSARDELERAKSNQEEVARFHQEAMFLLKSEQSKADVLEKEVRSHEESLNNIRRDLTGQIAYYGYRHLPDDKPEALLSALEERAVNWKRCAERKQELEKELFLAETQLKAIQRDQTQLKLELQGQKDQLKRAEAECGAFQHQRVGIFGEREPEREEARMEAAVEEARRQMAERRKAREEAQSVLDALTKRQHDLETTLAARRDQIQKGEIAFGKKLLANDFKSEDDYLAACLTEKDRKDIQGRLHALSQEELDLNARYLDKKFVVEELRGRTFEDGGGRERVSVALTALRDLYAEIRALAGRGGCGVAELLASCEEAEQEGEKDLGPLNSPEGKSLRALIQGFVWEGMVRRAEACLAGWGEARPIEGDIFASPQTPLGRFKASLALAVGLARTLAPRERPGTLFLETDAAGSDSGFRKVLLALAREAEALVVTSASEANWSAGV